MSGGAFEVRIDVDGWTLTLGAIEVNATGAIRDRGTIRATVTVRRNGELVHRDNVSLTGERSRSRFIARLAALGVQLEEAALLALDEIIRQSPRPSGNGHNGLHDSVYDTPSDFSETVTAIEAVREILERWLLLADDDVLTVILGAVIAHRLGGESPWLVVIAPPSGTKTELLRGLWRTHGVYPLSELTARTFASGLEIQNRPDPSLLARLTDEILVLKDLTTVLEMNGDERQAVLAQLREIYDGRFDKAWGTGKELHWEGRLGFIAGVTSVIDRHHAVMGLLGPRFLQVRLRQPSRQQMGERAIENASHEQEMRTEIAGAVASFLAQVPLTPPEVSPSIVQRVAAVADVVTRARSPVVRDGYRREIEHVPEPESPARLARQLHALLQGIVLVRGRDSATEDDVRLVARVARDCIPGLRWLALKTVYDTPSDISEKVTTTAIAQRVQQATATVRRAMEDLQALGLVACEKGGEGHADAWLLTADSRRALVVLFEPGTVSEKSDGVSYEESPYDDDDLRGEAERLFDLPTSGRLSLSK